MNLQTVIGPQNVPTESRNPRDVALPLRTVIGLQNVPKENRNPRDVALPRHAFLAALPPVALVTS